MINSFIIFFITNSLEYLLFDSLWSNRIGRFHGDLNARGLYEMFVKETLCWRDKKYES